MCTLTYIPTKNNNFILTHNRDEKYSRKTALLPSNYNINHINVIFPKDPEKGGTWIAIAENKFTVCLFNGAIQAHQSAKMYRKSRGLVLLDFFNFNNLNQFIINYNFKGIEPFTMIVLQHSNQIKLHEIVWNGSKINIIQRDANKHYIWSSVMLYNNELRKIRKVMFDEFINNNSLETIEENILNFHKKYSPEEPNNSLIIKNEMVSTVSISQIVKINNEIKINYFDLKNNNKYTSGFSFADNEKTK